ncbi:MAG: helix-turn-helix domain-containing protein [Myxococcota bacterium]
MAAGLAVFGRDGYDRATMSAVAAAAGVSRPTLYARFKNKDALLRAVTQSVFDSALSEVGVAIASGGPIGEVLCRIMECYYGELYDLVLSLESSAEVLEAQLRLAGDVVEEARSQLRSQLDQALRADDVTIKRGVTRSQLIELLMLAPRAFKEPATTSRQYRRRLRALARVVAHAVS